MEIGRSAEPLDEIQTLLAPVTVQDSHRDLLHVEGDGVSKEEHQEGWHQNHQGQASRIPVDMNKLFFGNRPGTGDLHRLSSFSIKETKTSSREGLIVPILLRRIPCFWNRTWTCRSKSAPSFPITCKPSPKTADSETQGSFFRRSKAGTRGSHTTSNTPCESVLNFNSEGVPRATILP